MNTKYMSKKGHSPDSSKYIKTSFMHQSTNENFHNQEFLFPNTTLARKFHLSFSHVGCECQSKENTFLKFIKNSLLNPDALNFIGPSKFPEL